MFMVVEMYYLYVNGYRTTMSLQILKGKEMSKCFPSIFYQIFLFTVYTPGDLLVTC